VNASWREIRATRQIFRYFDGCGVNFLPCGANFAPRASPATGR